MIRPALLTSCALATLSLTGCASMSPPSGEKLARLPVVEFPATPPAGEFILKLPAGQPIPARVIIDGTALARGADQMLDAALPHDLFIHRGWISQDGKTWEYGRDALNIHVQVALPSDAHPMPGKIHLTIDKAKP